MTIIAKPWMGQENGRILVVKGYRVVMSKHYRNLEHRKQIIDEICKTLEIRNESN